MVLDEDEILPITNREIRYHFTFSRGRLTLTDFRGGGYTLVRASATD